MSSGKRGYPGKIFGVGTAKVIEEVSSLNEIIVPGRVEQALHVHRKSPLRVCATASNRIVFGGCSPIKRLTRFTSRCTSILTGVDSVPAVVASHSRMVTTTKISGHRFLRHEMAAMLRKCVRGHGACSTARRALNSVRPVRNVRRCTSMVCPVVTTKSISNTMIVLANRRAGVPAGTRVGLTRATTTFLNGRVRR